MLAAWSGEAEELLSDEESIERDFSVKRFTNAYIDYPNPFERGDVVTHARSHGDCSVGLVATSQTEWEDFRRRVKDGAYVDQVDASLTVEWLTEDGNFSHEHIPPTLLERRNVDKNAPWCELVTAAQGLLRGTDGLEWFTVCCEEYRKSQGEESFPARNF